jgi:beta-lactamase regulating signal transducer with metallopeptidase domain
MTALTSDPFVHALAWALVHFLWQGAAIAALVLLWLRVGRPTPQARYAGGVAALAALLLAPVATFAVRAAATPAEPAAVTVRPLPAEPGDRMPVAVSPPAPVTAADFRTQAHTPLPAADIAVVGVVVAWLGGVLLLTVRLAGGWILARRLTVRGATPAAAEVCDRAVVLSRRLGLTRAVRIAESTAVSVPVLVGWMKPVVLFPAAALSGLSPGQVDALIAHELAHVRRHDYLVNLLQSVVETLLFYHPAVWIVSREVREAREQCCDDLAIGVSDRVVYVSALADLAAIAQTPHIAMAATSGSLLRRVQRLLGQPHEPSGPGMACLGVLTLALVLGGIVPSTLGMSASVAGSGSEDHPAGGPLDAMAGGRASIVGEGPIGDLPRAIAAGVPADVRTASGEDEARSERRAEVPPRLDQEARGVRQVDADPGEPGERAEQAQPPLEQRVAVPADVRALEVRLSDLERQVAAARTAGQQQQQEAAAPGSTVGDLRSTAQLEARAVRARSEVDAAQTLLRRVRELVERGLVPPSHVVDAEARLASGLRELSALAREASAILDETAMRDAIDGRLGQLQAQSRVAEARADVPAARQEVERLRQRFDVGLASIGELADAEARLAAAERRLASAAAELELQHEEVALRRLRLEALARLARELEEANWDVRAGIGAGDPGGLPAGPLVTDPAAEVQAGDILAIEIAGEPDLPRHFRVNPDGTIRLPLVGAITVAGLTAQQVRDTVAGALEQRQLAEGRTVTVSLLRPD